MTELEKELLKDGCHVKTIIKASTYTFNWTVENFSGFLQGTEMKSPKFHLPPNHLFYARLRLDNEFCGYLDFFPDSGTGIDDVRHTLSIKNRAGRVVFENTKLCSYNKYVFCNVLTNYDTKDAREEDVLIIKCVMECRKYQTDTNLYYNTNRNPVSPLEDLSALSNELKAIKDKLLYTDVSLKVGENIVRVHRLILCARSSVFARMFETPMDERAENVISISDLDLAVLQDLVSYLYTGVLAKDDFESVYALYYASDKYDVSSLRKTCIVVLLSKLDVENACRILALADRHSDVEFKNSVMDFIKFYFDKVLETGAWNELAKNTPLLATEVISAWSKNRLNGELIVTA